MGKREILGFVEFIEVVAAGLFSRVGSLSRESLHSRSWDNGEKKKKEFWGKKI